MDLGPDVSVEGGCPGLGPIQNVGSNNLGVSYRHY